MFKIILSLFLLLLFHLQVFSQTSKAIEGILVDETNVPVMGASILLKEETTNKIVAYTISNEQGKFYLDASPGQYILEVSHIAFSPYREEIELGKAAQPYQFNIKLQFKRDVLDEVVIQSRAGVANLKGDTLSYNLNAYTTGNEQKLKDLINKLPGLEVGEDGAINFNGKRIDNLLVDGKPFFGDNHKIATDNLNAEMVGGIDLLRNYENLEDVKDFGGSDETALNIEIKEKYRGKPTGDLSGLAAYKERYKLHSNLYLFTKKYNISFIVDANNLGQQPMNIREYINMDIDQGIVNNDDVESSIDPHQELPNFLQGNKNEWKHDSKFAALNAVFSPTKNLVINAFSILNKEKIFEKLFSEKTYFGQAAQINISENIEGKRSFLFNQTKLNAEYKPSDNSLLNYSFTYKPKKNDYDSNIKTMASQELQSTKEFNTIQGYRFRQQLSYISRISKNKLLSFKVFSNTGFETNELFIESNDNLFDEGNIIAQEQDYKLNELGFYSSYTQRIKNHIAKLNLGFVWQENSFSSGRTVSSENSIIQNTQNYFYAGATVQKKEGFFQYKALLNFRKYNLNHNEKQDNKYLFLPILEGKFTFSQTNYLELSYQRKVGFPTARQLNRLGYAIDYRNYRYPTEVLYHRPVLQNNFNLSYFYFNLFSGTLVFFNSSYIKSENQIGTNSEVINNFNYLNYINTPYSSNWINVLKFETRINPIKTKLKIDLEYTNLVSNNYIDYLKNIATTNIYTIKPALVSYFKDSWLNYELGLEYSMNTTTFSLFSNTNKGSKTRPFVNLNGQLGSNWAYYIDNSMLFFKVNNLERNFYQLDVKLNYRNSKESRFEYWIAGKDILNINNQQIIKSETTNNIFSRNIVYRLAGFIGVGLSYNF